MSNKQVFTNNGSVRTAFSGKAVPAYACWKKIETMTKGDERWKVDPVFLEYSSFHRWHTARGTTDGLVIAYNCVGYDDYRIGPDVSAMLPKPVWQALLSKKPGLTPTQRLEILRAVMREYEGFFKIIPKIRTLLWDYRYEPEEATESSETGNVAADPYAAITVAIAEKVNYDYDTLSDDVLFQLYFDLQESLVVEASRIRIPAWVHLYSRILEAVKSVPMPKPAEPEKPLTVEEQVVELTRDVKMVTDSMGEFETRLDKLVEMIKPSTITEIGKSVAQFRNSVNGLELRMMGIVEAAKKENAQYDMVLTSLVNRIKHLEDLQLEKMEPPKVSVEPAKDDKPEAPIATKVKPDVKTLPEVVIVGLVPETAQRVSKEYNGRINLIILPLNVDNKRLKAVCKDRNVLLMTAFSGHSITNTIKSVTNKVTTVGNGVTSLTRELDTYLPLAQ